MSMQHSWVITHLECYPEHEGYNNVVSTIYWRRQVNDDTGHMCDIGGVQPITLNNSDTFTPFEHLTKMQVEAWLASALGADVVASLDELLNEQIEARINMPVIAPPLPW